MSRGAKLGKVSNQRFSEQAKTMDVHTQFGVAVGSLSRELGHWSGRDVKVC